MTQPLTPEQLTGRHARLRLELSRAFLAPAWRVGQIERLAEELADASRALAAAQPVDEQTDDPLLGLGW